MDKAKIEKAVRDILEAIGEDPDREGLIETPKRVANLQVSLKTLTFILNFLTKKVTMSLLW